MMEKRRRREEEEGGTWRPDVAAVAEGRLCVALQDHSECRKKPHIRQTDKQTDSWVLSRPEEHLEKVSLSLFPQLS